MESFRSRLIQEFSCGRSRQTGPTGHTLLTMEPVPVSMVVASLSTWPDEWLHRASRLVRATIDRSTDRLDVEDLREQLGQYEGEQARRDAA